MNLNKRLIKGGAVAALAGVVTLASVLPGSLTPETSKTINEKVSEVASKEQLPLNFVASAQSTEEIASELTGMTTDVVVEEEAAAEAVSPWESKLMPNVEEFLTIRTEATTESDPAGKLPRGAAADILERGEGWTKIHSGSVEGYVNNEYALFGADAEAMANELGTTYATSTVEGLRIRADGSTEAAIIGVLNTGGKIVVDTAVEAPEGWVAVKSGDVTAFVSAEYVTVELELGKAISVEEEQAAIAAAKAEEEARRAAAEAAAAEKKAEAERKAAADKKAADEAAAKAAQESSTTRATTNTTDSSSTESSTATTQSENTAPTQSTTQNAAVTASHSDLALLAAIIECEAGGESYQGQVAVGSVVMNRVRDGRYPNSISGVIYQSGQFTPASSGALANVLARGAKASCVQAAQEALNGADVVGGRLSFRSNSNMDGLRIGGHVFF